MNHYDGPAFFRKYRVTKPQVNSSAAASQSTSAASSASSQTPTAARVSEPVRQPVKETAPAVKSQAPFSGGTHGAFHPSPVPSQLRTALTDGGIIRSQDTTNYLEIEASLHKQPATFLLFSTAADTELPLVDLQQPLAVLEAAESQVSTLATSAVSVSAASAAATASATDTSTPASTEAEVVTDQLGMTVTSPVDKHVEAAAAQATPVSAAMAPTVVFEPTEPELAVSAAALLATPVAPTVVFEPTQPALANSAAARLATPAALTVVFEPTEPELAEAVVAPLTTSAKPTVVFEPTEPELAASAAAVNTSAAMTTVVFEPTQPVASAASSADDAASTVKPSHGLGVSLGDIMTAEHDAQSELALFKDQPNATTATPVSAEERPVVSEADDEPYQPVGMRRPQSHAVTAAPSSSATPTGTTQAVPVSTASVVTPASTVASAIPAPEEHQGGSAAPVLADKELAAYHLPPLDLLKAPVIPNESEMDDWIQEKAITLGESLEDFGVAAHVVDWTVGPTITQFQVKLDRGVKVNKITNLDDDLKLALAVKQLRIEAPIPGHNTVGIEIPNLKSRPVMLSEVLDSKVFRESKSPLTVALGVDLFGQPRITDLRKMPHGLIAGSTGSGKSVFINSILVSLLYKANPQEVKLLLVDPKAVELAPYNEIPHLLAPVISEPKAASAALKWVVDEMDHRYDRLAAGGARNIEQFNKLAEKHHEPGLKMPYIVIVIDELADLMMVASSEVQDYIARITAKARAAGIHLLVATQRPSVDVVTGVIKNNIPTRIAFMTSSQVDSRTILDSSGAEQLLGRGDMLYLGNGQSNPLRLQGTFVDSEIDDITEFVREQAAPHYEFQPDKLLKHEEAAKNADELMPEVLAYIADEDTMSTSKLQRNFSIGYNRAANIIDDLESRGYVSGNKGSKPRDVYFTAEDLTKLQANS